MAIKTTHTNSTLILFLIALENKLSSRPRFKQETSKNSNVISHKSNQPQLFI